MKKKLIALLSCLLLAVGLMGCASAGADEKKEEVKKDPNKKAILVVSFGTSYPDTRKLTIEACEEKIDKAFPEYEKRRAFTSDIIIKKIKEQENTQIDTPKEALTKLKEEGFSEVVVQPLHVINGEEYDELAVEVENFKKDFDKIIMGKALLSSVEDYEKVAKALKAQMPETKEKEAVVFMGHGTPHDANAAYACLDYMFEDMGMKAFIGTVEGYPALDQVIKKLKENNIEKVTLMPLMVVAGDHASNDMAGEEEDSWKTILKKEGFVVETYLHGMGENAGIQEIYVEHAKKAMAGEEK